MTRIIEVLQTILPVMIMLCIGMICRSRQLISREGINALKSVAVNIALPAVLLSAFATTCYTFMDVIIPLMMFMVCVAAWALGKAGAKLLGMSSRFVPFLTTGFEAGMLGYAVNVMFILPPPFVLPVFADDADQRVYVSSALSISTIVAIAGFAVLAAV